LLDEFINQSTTNRTLYPQTWGSFFICKWHGECIGEM